MTFDGNEDIVYQDLNRRKIFRISHGEGGWGKPEELLDQAQAKCTVAIDGKSYTYSNIDISQIFYDEFADMFLLCGEFKEFDPTNDDGWSTPDISQKLKGIFAWKDNEIVYWGSFNYRKLAGALSDGRYIVTNYSYDLLFGGYPEIWDPERQTFTEIDSTSGDFSYVVQIGRVDKVFPSPSNYGKIEKKEVGKCS